MRWGNLHTHTVFSDGQHTPEDNCAAAVAEGLAYLGFSDHAWGPKDEAWCLGREAFPEYAARIRALKDQYAGQLPVYLGLEVDDQSGPVEEELDFVIGAVHTLDLPGGYYSVDGSPAMQQAAIDEAFGGSALDFAKCYFDRVVAFTERLKPTYIAHFDLVTKFGRMPQEDPAYRDYAIQALQAALTHCPYLEVNTGAISRGWQQDPYPSRFLLEAALQAGAKPVLGADSHNKDHLTCAFDRAAALLKDVGFDTLCRFNGKTFDQISI